jgi:ATP-dependent Clp protease ATP-binding subunit ClpC
MFESFNAPARKVLDLAQQEARQLMHEQVGPEHILLGFIRAAEQDAGVARTCLKNLGVKDFDKARREVFRSREKRF